MYRPDPKNARKHPERNKQMIRASLEEVGPFRSIAIDGDGIVRAGNGVYEQAQALGLKVREVEAAPDELIAVKRPDLRGKMAERAAQWDNRAAETAEWDLSLMPEFDWSGMFEPDEMAALLEQVEPLPVEDEPVEIAQEGETRVKPGDVWRVGPHIVACLDSTEPGNLDRVLGVAGRKPRMVAADPPYGISAVDVNKGTLNSGNPYPFGGLKGSVGSGNPIPATQYAPVIGDDTTETARKAATLLLAQYPKAIHFWWGANHYADVLPPSSCWVVWDKRDDTTSNDFADGELAWSNQKLAIRIFRHLWSGLMKASEKGDRRVHPTQKPQALFVWLYERYGSPGDLILDPFLGSGPSLKAAHQMGDRTVVGFELSPHYCDHILEWAGAEGLTCERVEP